ncbi:MAG: hypothetical protein V3U54_07750 [Thermodesulfobacteriota bacterium]
MKLIETPEIEYEEQEVQYNGEHPYVKDLVSNERHPVTAHTHELVWRVWPVTDSRLYKLKYWGSIERELIAFENQHQPPFFIYLGADFKIPYLSLADPSLPSLSNLELVEYIGQKRIEYEEFLVRLKTGQKR